ncbi:leucyl/phenylalanyl-tRNA--protein transferase [Brevibacterium samyangense]|uniref:Leucyl/phenylalanyl-tRNA--protein transferase n=1 Tax=Brevibacterium samyangense TaxID=366888 RepID=A0ABN2THP4_9MICO
MDPGDLRAIGIAPEGSRVLSAEGSRVLSAEGSAVVDAEGSPDTSAAGWSADLVYAAYRAGLFPMGLGEAGTGPVGWWAPRLRGVLRPGELRVSTSLRKSRKRFRVTIDTCFEDVMRACADPSRPGAWITPDFIALYCELHRTGRAHSVEVWNRETGALAGGLYGVAFGGVFAGESMFHRERDASKVALVELVELLDSVDDDVPWLIDTQWQTSHLASLGVSAVDAFAYAKALESARHGFHSQAFPNQ